jgi:hypothetical protein
MDGSIGESIGDASGWPSETREYRRGLWIFLGIFLAFAFAIAEISQAVSSYLGQ